MLEDFADDLKRQLHQRLDNAIQTLKGNVDPARPRGLIEAYESALSDVEDLLAQYALPESAPEQLSLPADNGYPATPGRRLYGRAA